MAGGPAGMVAVGNAVAGDHGELFAEPLVLHSTDGATWTPTDSASTPAGYRSAVAFVPGTRANTLVAVGLTGTDVSVDAAMDTGTDVPMDVTCTAQAPPYIRATAVSCAALINLFAGREEAATRWVERERGTAVNLYTGG